MKKILSKKLLKNLWLIYSLSSVFIVIFLVNNLIRSDINKTSDMKIINDNWSITVNDKVYENANLKDFRASSLKIGDTITMSTVISDEWDYESPTLYFFSRHSTLKVYIDNNIIYSYGEKRYKDNKSLGCGIHFINFSNDYKGKTLLIELIITEDNAFSRFDSVYITEWSNSYRYFMTDNFVPLLVDSFLVIFGIFVILFSIFAITYSKKYVSFFLLAIFSMCMGLWSLCYHNILAIFSIPIYSISLMEYMALYIAPIPFIGFVYSYVKVLSEKIYKIIYNVLFLFQSIFTIVAITLHTLDIVHAAKLQKGFHAMLLIHLLFFATIFYKNIKYNYLNKKSYIFGLLFFSATIIYDTVGYNLQRSFGADGYTITGLSSIGIAMFLAILAIDVYHGIAKKTLEENEKELLIRHAYTDHLTDVYNRRYCAEYMSKLDNEKNASYSIIIFDLNNLKMINDNYGHTIGDKFIKESANIINISFREHGIVGRLGGDEFIALIDTNDKNLLKSMISEFEKHIKNYNNKNKDFEISIAYGLATCDESEEPGTENIYRIADTRMYECKVKQKSSL